VVSGQSAQFIQPVAKIVAAAAYYAMLTKHSSSTESSHWAFQARPPHNSRITESAIREHWDSPTIGGAHSWRRPICASSAHGSNRQADRGNRSW
jgi:hypothetical protein